MASSAGCVVIWSCSDIMEDRHWLTDAYILFATPYFAYDIYAMFLCYKHRLQVKGHEEAGEELGGFRSVIGYLRREILMVLHHVFMVTFCFPASLLWRRGKGDYFQGVLFLAELSTPSVCLGKVLIQYQKQQTLLHKLNGVIMLISFFSCRVLMFPFLYYKYSRYQPTDRPTDRPSDQVSLTAPPLLLCLRYASIPLCSVPLVAPWQCNLGAALLWPLQLYWFSLMCRGALRLFRQRSNSPPKTFTLDHGDHLSSANGPLTDRH
ncbi:TLC domain containing 3Ba isoform X3 [Echeneis naucrates]|nr:protein FAM57B-like isoform X3 [Echeneis naucrates]